MAPPSTTFLLVVVLALVAVEGCLASVGEPKKEEPRKIEAPATAPAPKGEWGKEEPKKGEWKKEEPCKKEEWKKEEPCKKEEWKKEEPCKKEEWKREEPCKKEGWKKEEKKELRVRIAVQKDTTNFIGRYPEEAGSARVVYGAAYDFLDAKKQLGHGVGKCTVVKVFKEGRKDLKNFKGLKKYLETCVFSFNFKLKGQIIVVGDINTTYEENTLAVTGGTRSFVDASGQVVRRVLPRSECVFKDTLKEIEYKFEKCKW